MPFTQEQVEVLSKASNNFTVFVNEIFSLSEKNFIGGEHVDNTCRFLSSNQRTIRVSARNHFKSFAFYAHFMWKLMFEGAATDLEGQYFSFNGDLAAYHISKIKRCIMNNPYFDDIIDGKVTAESVLKYSWDGKHWTTLHPHGLIQFKRGIHADLVYVDDPFQDPDNELNQAVIYKINDLFKSNILDMPKEPDGELHCAGTPQTNNDFFFDKSLTARFAVSIQPAIQVNPITQEEFALWPEWMNLEELYKKREERTARIFSKEYLCTPVYSTKGFFSKDTLNQKIVNSDLTLLNPHKMHITANEVIAGFDIGKKTHPSHLSVFERRGNKLVMIHQKFMDGWNYSNGKDFYDFAPTQLEYLKMCIKNFGIRELKYDNTRGEFESFDEQGLLPRQMTPIVFNNKLKSTASTAFDKLVERAQLEIPNDQRLINQICAVMSDLQAIETVEGHGDCYDDKTEVLTKTGWKFFKDLHADDEIATLKNQSVIEYQKPTNIINEVYSGKMYEIATTQVNLCVTPRHKLFVKNRREYELVKPEEIDGKIVKYKKNATWNGKEVSNFKLGNIDIPMDTFLAFIGYYVAEGYNLKGKYINISQKKGEKADKIFNDLKRLPFNVRQQQDVYHGSTEFYSTALVKWCDENLGKYSKNKHLPDWVFSLSTRQLRILYDALILGDGSKRMTQNNQVEACYNTISETLANQFQHLCLHVGLSANIYFSDDNIGRPAPHGFGRYRTYRIKVITQKNEPAVNKHVKSDRWIDYTGNIYCVTVPNHVIYVRRNGKPVWSGNSFWSIALAITCAPDIVGFIMDESQDRPRHRITTGIRSIFADGAGVPRGW